MAQISVLKKEVSELIAAGEVIERPASVVKELVENAIDAEAKHITVEIKNGGTTYMRIVDDGCGIAPEDVPTAFLRHATSKIKQKEDLDNIYTLGFRGEALASVSAVSKVNIMSKRSEDEYGTHYELSGGVPEYLPEQIGCPNGTTIIIRDLFYNVPVRQKFMKKDVSEANAVSNIVQKVALSHPEIAFQMIRDNRTEFCTDGNGDLYSAIYSIFGKEFAHDMIPVSYDDGFLKIDGYICKPLYAKSRRTFQNFFINGRYIRSNLCSVALESAYKNLIMTGKFPSCVLMIQINPSDIDVNVHPAKAEIRFSNEKNVIDGIFFAVKNALMENGLIYEFQIKQPVADWRNYKEPENIVQPKLPDSTDSKSVLPILPDSNFSDKDEFSTVHVQSENQDSEIIPEKIFPTEYHKDIGEFFASMSGVKPVIQNYNNYNDVRQKKKSEQFYNENNYDVNNKIDKAKEQVDIVVIGEVFKNYILAESKDKLLIFDKHAAHERVLFEKLKSGKGEQYRQLLMQSTETLLAMEEFDVIQQNESLLESMGFLFDFSASPYLKTMAVPMFLKELNIDEIIMEIANNLVVGKENPEPDYIDDMLHTIACKAAIKANDKNDISELQKLVQEVYIDEKIRHCPHGRPVMFVITKHELEKQFKRI